MTKGLVMTITKKSRILIVLFALMMCVSLLSVPVDAASKPAKVGNVKATAQSTTAIKVTWNKVRGAAGYQVYQGKTRVATVKGNSYTKGKLKPNTKYTYKVRAYKTYKQTQWYNKKTKKWQTSKPAYRNRGKSRKVTKYLYGPFSNVVSRSTKPVVATGVTLSGPSQVYWGSTGKYSAVVKPANTSVKKVTYSVSDTSIATINQNGVLTPKDEGDVRVTVKTSNGKTASKVVQIRAKTATYTIVRENDEYCNGCGVRLDICDKNGVESGLTPAEWSAAGHGSSHDETLIKGKCYFCGGDVACRGCPAAWYNGWRDVTPVAFEKVEINEAADWAILYEKSCPCGRNCVLDGGNGVGLVRIK